MVVIRMGNSGISRNSNVNADCSVTVVSLREYECELKTVLSNKKTLRKYGNYSLVFTYDATFHT